MLNFKKTTGVEELIQENGAQSMEFCPQKSTNIKKTKKGRRMSLEKHLLVLVSPRMNCSCARVALADVGFAPTVGKEPAYVAQWLQYKTLPPTYFWLTSSVHQGL